jgi:hypothetical protein
LGRKRLGRHPVIRILELERAVTLAQLNHVVPALPRCAEANQYRNGKDKANDQRDSADGNSGSPHYARGAIGHKNRVTP